GGKKRGAGRPDSRGEGIGPSSCVHRPVSRPRPHGAGPRTPPSAPRVSSPRLARAGPPPSARPAGGRAPPRESPPGVSDRGLPPRPPLSPRTSLHLTDTRVSATTAAEAPG